MSVFNDIIDRIKENSFTDQPEYDENIKSSIDRFNLQTKDPKSTQVEQDNSPFLEPGKIYVFKYKPITPLAQLDKNYRDRHPIVLNFGKLKGPNGFYHVGLNLSYFPQSARKYFIQSIRQLYKVNYDSAIFKNKNSAVKQTEIHLNLYTLKKQFDQYGFSWGIRSYIPERIEKPKYCICYENWDKILAIDTPNVFPQLKGKIGLKTIYDDYKLYLIDCKNNKAELDLKNEANRKANKYKFIK